MIISIIVLLSIVVTQNVCGENNVIVKDIRRSLAVDVFLSTVPSTSNMVVAPLPLQFSLSKLASVARGKAKDELMKGLGFVNDTMVKDFYSKFRQMLYIPQRTVLTYVNKIYLDYNKKINSSFAANSSLLYGVHVDRVSYSMPRSATTFINKGIASATLRRIENVLNAYEINNLTSLLLVTAGHFKPTWDKPFYSVFTRTKPFQLLNNKKVDVSMMWQVGEFQYYDARDYQVIVKVLGCPGLSMTFVRPDFLSLDEFLEKLAQYPDTLKNIRDKMGVQLLQLQLPRIKIKSEIDLDKFLKKGGIKDIFKNESTGLNAILKDGAQANNVFVSKVRQKLFIEIDEFGISRAERELSQPDGRVHPGTPEVIFDRPFYFTVNFEFWFPPRNTPVDTYELFSGVYYGPQ